jgi:hypothetical protein
MKMMAGRDEQSLRKLEVWGGVEARVKNEIGKEREGRTRGKERG